MAGPNLSSTKNQMKQLPWHYDRAAGITCGIRFRGTRALWRMQQEADRRQTVALSITLIALLCVCFWLL